MELNNMAEAANDGDSKKEGVSGRWTTEEHSLFILGLQLHNRHWKNIADMVKTRTVVQIRTHAQKYFQKMEKTNPSGGFPNGKSLSENGLFSESNGGDGEDGTRLPNYRSQSIGSTDSADSSKFGRSVSLGSDVGNDSDADKNASLAPGSVPHCSSFPSDMMIHQYMSGVELKPRSATMTDMKAAGSGVPLPAGPKKRSRDTLSSGNKANNTSMTANPPKSPKRASSKHHQQQAQMAHVASAPNLPLMGTAAGGGYMMPHGHHGLVHSVSECDELDMISLLEKIDWNAIPSPQHHRSPASSPFTDSAASLSSSSGHISYKSVLNKCNLASSPLQFSHIDQVNVNEELTDSDVFDVFDEYYRNVDLQNGSSSSSALNVIPIATPSIKSETAMSAVVPLAPPSYQPPQQQQPVVMQETARKEPRVWFSSSVICELKTKTNPVQPGFSIGHGILKPWRERKPVSQLPPLRTLTSNAPPVVIPTQSLTLLDSTFCNYPPALYQNDTMMDLGGSSNSVGGISAGYLSDSATLTSAESSNSAYCIGGMSGGLSLDSPSLCSEDVMGSPKSYTTVGSSTNQGMSMLSLTRPPEFSLSLGTAPQSPAVKKRGRPRKNSLTSGSGSSSSSSGATTTVKSRSCSNLSASNAPIIGGSAMQPSVAPMTGSYLASYPSFPAMGATVTAPPALKETRTRRNSLTSQSTGDLMVHQMPPPYDDFMMSCREVDPTNTFAYQLSHEHDPVGLSMSSTSPHHQHHLSGGMMMAGGMGVGGVSLVGGSVLDADPLFDPRFHADGQEMDCGNDLSFGFDEHELQTDANVVGGAVAAANLSKSVAAAAASAIAVVAPAAASSSNSSDVVDEPMKTEEGEDFYDMLSAVLE